MIVSILYGRSWQGVSEATNILGNAAFSSKFQVQEIIEVADKSLPVLGSVAMDKQAIESRQHEASDYLLVFDSKMDISRVLKQAKDKSVVILNSQEKIKNPLLGKKGLRAFFVDATGLAITATLKASPYAAMMGAFAKIAGIIPAKYIRSQMTGGNLAAFDEGFKGVKRN